MEARPRCKKCGRLLKSPASIARGMGSKCAGVSVTSGKTFDTRIKRSSGKAYQSICSNRPQSTIFSGDLSTKPVSKREVFRRVRDERRKLFEERKPFQCGVFPNTRTPLIYVPSGDGVWKEYSSGRVISHERLQEYLKRYQFI